MVSPFGENFYNSPRKRTPSFFILHSTFSILNFFPAFCYLTVFFPRGKSAADMPFLFVYLKQPLHLRVEVGVFLFSRSLTSLCTVLLDMPNCFAAARTVELCSTMYLPSATAR